MFCLLVLLICRCIRMRWFSIWCCNMFSGGSWFGLFVYCCCIVCIVLLSLFCRIILLLIMVMMWFSDWLVLVDVFVVVCGNSWVWVGVMVVVVIVSRNSVRGCFIRMEFLIVFR